MRAETYADLARQYALFCKNHGDNVLHRIAAGASENDYAWTEALMRAVDELGHGAFPVLPFEAISVHYYTIGGTWMAKGSATQFDDDGYWRTIVAAQDIEPLLRRHIAVMDRYDPLGQVGLVLDEWGTWWDVEPGQNPGFLYQQNTMRDALVASLHFDVFHRLADRLLMANIAQTVNVLQAMLLTDEETGTLVRTPTYHVFEMNKVHHDATSVPVHVRAPQAQREVAGHTVLTLSASASVDAGRCHISLTNTDLEHEVLVDLDLRGATLTELTARVLSGQSAGSFNSAEHPEDVSPQPLELTSTSTGARLTLPPHSFAIVEAA
jgi:alpha-N-arabinofuranosidase